MEKIKVTLESGEVVQLDPNTTHVIIEQRLPLATYLEHKGKDRGRVPTRCKFKSKDVIEMKALRIMHPKKTLRELRTLSGDKWSEAAIGRSIRGEYDFLLEKEVDSKATSSSQ